MTDMLEAQVDRAAPKIGALPRSRKKSSVSHSSFTWYAMIVPAVGLVGVLIVYPMIESLLLSFQSVRGRRSEWVGLENFSRLFSDGEAFDAVRVTITLTAGTLILQLFLAWGLALLLWRVVGRMGAVLRVLFAIPMLLSPVVVGVVWGVLLNPGYGWIPAAIGQPGLTLLSNPQTALPTLIVVEAWQWTPFMFIIIVSGLAAIPADLTEAARIDGASNWRLFWSIIWPLTLPVTLVALLFRGLEALKAFDLPFNLTAGGPGTATQTVAMYLYRQAFIRFDQGYASAVSLLGVGLMLAYVLILVFFIVRAGKRIS